MASEEELPEQNFLDWFDSEFDNALSKSLCIVGLRTSEVPDVDQGDVVQLSTLARIIRAVPHVVQRAERKFRAFERLRWYVLKLLSESDEQIRLTAGVGAFARMRSDLHRLFGLYAADPDEAGRLWRNPDVAAFEELANRVCEWSSRLHVKHLDRSKQPPVVLRGPVRL